MASLIYREDFAIELMPINSILLKFVKARVVFLILLTRWQYAMDGPDTKLAGYPNAGYPAIVLECQENSKTKLIFCHFQISYQIFGRIPFN